MDRKGFFESAHGRAVAVFDGGENADQADIDLEGALLRRNGNQQRGEEQQEASSADYLPSTDWSHSPSTNTSPQACDGAARSIFGPPGDSLQQAEKQDFGAHACIVSDGFESGFRCGFLDQRGVRVAAVKLIEWYPIGTLSRVQESERQNQPGPKPWLVKLGDLADRG